MSKNMWEVCDVNAILPKEIQPERQIVSDKT